jgi:transglutaminase-like putative cysteine protease
VSGDRRRVTLSVACALAAGAWLASRLPGCPAWLPVASLLAVAARVLSDRWGAPAASPKVLALVAFPLLVSAFMASSGEGRVAALVLAAGIPVALAPAPLGDPASLLGLSLAAGALGAGTLPEHVATGATLLYGALLVLALVGLERSGPAAAGVEAAAGARRLRTGPGRRTATLAAALPLLLLALPMTAVGASAVWRARPSRDEEPRAAGGVPTAGGGARSVGARWSGKLPTEASREFLRGARTGARLGFVSSVKEDDRPQLSLTVLGGLDDVVPTLRGHTYDEFGGTEWRRSADAQRSAPASADDEAGEGWLAIAARRPGGTVRRAEVVDLRGETEGHVFLWPWTHSVKVAAADRAARLEVAVDGTAHFPGRIAPGEGYREIASEPDPAEWSAARSAASAAPLPTYLDAGPDAATLRELAKEAVAGAVEPAARAERMATWLRRRCAYALAGPRLDDRRPVTDFLVRVKRGNCEMFASSMTLMMRSLGHPARYAVGFRGGLREGEDRVLFLGTHAHAWCEVLFDGVGWVPYDPTPPDEEAVDAEGAAPPPPEPEAGDDGPLSGIAKVLPWTLLATLLGAAYALWRASRRGGATAAPGGPAPGPAAPSGPYARATLALRAAGVVRPRPETATEFAAAAADALPRAAGPFRVLTTGFEDERYGGRPAAGQALDALEAAADAVCAAARAARQRRATT